jgi:hypothetical protein
VALDAATVAFAGAASDPGATEAELLPARVSFAAWLGRLLTPAAFGTVCAQAGNAAVIQPMAASATRRRHVNLDLVIFFPPNKKARDRCRDPRSGLGLDLSAGERAERLVWILARLPVYRHRYLRHLPNFRHIWQVQKNRIARKNR